MHHLYEGIPEFPDWELIKPIHKGWSKDEKYFVQSRTGERYLLRISEGRRLTEEQDVYASMEKLTDALPVSKLLRSGLCNAGQNTYRIFSWREGQEAPEVLPGYSAGEQYQLGLYAGEILREIHQIPCPPDREPWEPYFNRKIDRNIRRYKASGIGIAHAHKLLDFVDANRHLLGGRPQCFHHGDYHLGNMIISPSGELSVIDFNRLDYGDPWEEFNRMPWTVSQSAGFANGMIHGYFPAEVPEEFFPLMALYIGSNQLSAVAWAMEFGQKEIEVITLQTQEVMSWYGNFDQCIPSWYVHKSASRV